MNLKTHGSVIGPNVASSSLDDAVRKLAVVGTAAGSILLSAGAFAAAHPAFGDPSAPADPPVDRNDCLIWGTNEVNLGPAVRVFRDSSPAGSQIPDANNALVDQPRSDVCSPGTVDITGSLVPKGGKAGDVSVIGTNVKLNGTPTTYEVVYDDVAGSYVNTTGGGAKGPTILRTDADFTGIVPFFDFPFGICDAVNNPPALEGENIIVPSGGTAMLSPGVISGRILVNTNARLIFDGPGDYRLRSLRTTGRANLLFENQVNPPVEYSVGVCEFVALGENVKFNRARTRFVNVYVEGADDDWGGLNPNNLGLGPAPAAAAAFQNGGDGEFQACRVLVPSGTVNVRGNQLYRTHFLGNNLQHLGLNAKFRYPSELCEGAQVECNCIEIVESCDTTSGFSASLVTGADADNMNVESWVLSQGGVTVATIPFDPSDCVGEVCSISDANAVPDGDYLIQLVSPEAPNGKSLGRWTHESQTLTVSGTDCTVESLFPVFP